MTLSNKPHRSTWVEINLKNLKDNLLAIRNKVGLKAKIIAVVKADGYGHGIESIKTLQENQVDAMAVAFLDEALVLRQEGINVPQLMILGATQVDEIPFLVQYKIQPTIFNMDFAHALSDYCVHHHCQCDVHIKVDTGMGRLGFDWDSATENIEYLITLSGLRIQGLFSHFATADEADQTYTKTQLGRFSQVVNGLKKKGINIPQIHFENSGAIMQFDQTMYNAIRPGIILYGLYPSDEVIKSALPLKPVMSFKTTITQIRDISIGETVGYGRKFMAKKPTRVGVMPVGYADGYTRLLSNIGTEVMIGGKRATIIGNICMDQSMVDLSDLPMVQLGDEVELFGENLPVEELATKLGTINYELICMVNKRVPRIVV